MVGGVALLNVPVQVASLNILNFVFHQQQFFLLEQHFIFLTSF